MKEEKIIKLSFDDNNKKIFRNGIRTTATITSYFKFESLERVFRRAGFQTIPSNVIQTLEEYGYSYDYTLIGWKVTMSASIMLNPKDTDDNAKAQIVATAKVKKKSLAKASKCMEKIAKNFGRITHDFDNTANRLRRIKNEESDALEKFSQNKI